MSDLPPSSVSLIVESPFFHHPDGQRILFFVEAGGILHRPRLIRTLKKHDAVICTDPKHAQIILVDPDSWQGKEFIREWGNDQNKVVLSYTWVIKSIDAVKPLLERDNWGGCKTYDDGLPISRPVLNKDEETTVFKSKAMPMKIQVGSPDGKGFTDSSTQRASVENSLLREKTTPVENGGSSSSIVHLPSHMSNPSQSSHTKPMPNLSSSASDPVPLFTQQQRVPLAMPLSMPGINMMSFPPQMLSMFAQQSAIAQSPMSAQPSSMMPQVQENFTTALIDIMRMYGTLPGGGLGTMSLGQRPMLPGMMGRQMSQSAVSSGSASVVLEDSPRASSNIRDTGSPNLLSSQELNSLSALRPSVKRKRNFNAVEDSFGHEVRETEDDNHEKDDDPLFAAPHKKNRRVEERESKSMRKNTDTRRAQKTSHLPTPSRNQHQTSRPSNSNDKLFVHVNGKPIQFFVQVDMNNRQEVTRAIKKHGGMITPRIPGADYAVLYPFSTSFKSLLGQAVGAQTRAVTHHFVLDSIDEGSIPDNIGDYALNTKKSPQARQKIFRTAAEAESKRLEKNTRQSEKKRAAIGMKYNYVARSEAPEMGPSTSLSSISSSPASTVGKAIQKPCSVQIKDEERHRPVPVIKSKASSRTSSPIPTVKKPTFPVAQSFSGQTVIPEKMGKKAYYPKEVTPPLSVKAQRFAAGYLYTQEERDWAERYIFILFKRNPDMSLTAIAKVLHRKLPHHSAHSWSSFLLGSFRSEYEETRKKGGIAHRKEKSKWEAEQEKEEEVEVNNFQTISERKQEPDHIKVKQENEELEKWHEHAEKVIEDQANPSLPGSIILKELSQVSPTHIDLDSKVVEEVKGASIGTSGVAQYTEEEEADIQTLVHFFLSGGDDGESDESLIWAKLAEKKVHRTAEEWEKVFSQHDKEIISRYQSCVTGRDYITPI